MSTMTGGEGKRMKTILCVDDDPAFLDSLRMILEEAGYVVRTAQSAEAGLTAYKEAKPDLVLADLMMEEVDSGISLVKDIRALGPTPPVYIFSSVGDGLNSSVDYSSLGVNGILQKPLNPERLLATIEAQFRSVKD